LIKPSLWRHSILREAVDGALADLELAIERAGESVDVLDYL